jgi:nitroimidazol reductase NimA-like FMN-containing flavoprotein (pyridoxamine 5'-phosphate oxidase superfamily)
MIEQEPVTELSPFSSPGAVQTEWSRARAELANAEVYWLSTVRPDGCRHVTPLSGVWLDGALYFCTGPDERKAKNLSENLHCVLTTGHNTLEGLDLVLEGTAEQTRDPAELGHVADTFESKYGAHFTAPNGTWSGLGDAIRRAEALVYRVAPVTGFGFRQRKALQPDAVAVLLACQAPDSRGAQNARLGLIASDARPRPIRHRYRASR